MVGLVVVVPLRCVALFVEWRREGEGEGEVGTEAEAGTVMATGVSSLGSALRNI